MGPVVGGAILSTLGWRWIFWINIPICMLGLYGCKQLPKIKQALHQTPIHYFNLILVAVSLVRPGKVVCIRQVEILPQQGWSPLGSELLEEME